MPPRRFVYLDHSATTPVDPRVVEAMLPYMTEDYGNASSAHWAGRKAERAIDDARAVLARVFNCQPGEIVFTSGGTESDNLAIRGAAYARRGDGAHLVTAPTEHSAVSRTVRQLAAHADFDATFVAVDEYASIDLEIFDEVLVPGTTIASLMMANNEVGTILPIAQLAETAHARRVWFHTDAVQAAGQLPLDVRALGVDMMSVSAHKFYGPKGVGALYVRQGIDLLPSQSGGSHEEGRRGGTLNTAGIVGMARALELACQEMETRTAHYVMLRDALIDGVTRRCANARLTGHPTARLPTHASFVFAGIEANTLLMHLDMKGIAASSASACKTGNPEPSGVLLAMGYPRELALGSLRVTVGKSTTAEDVEYAIDTIAETVEKLIKLGKYA